MHCSTNILYKCYNAQYTVNYTKDIFNYILFNSGHIYHLWYPAQIVKVINFARQ